MTTDTTSAPAAHVSDFTRALSDYLDAREHLNAMDETTGKDAYRRAELAYVAADRALIETPAKDIDELRVKADLLLLDPASQPSNKQLLEFFADLRRLTGETQSQLFNAREWLARFERNGGMYCARDVEVFLLTPAEANLEDGRLAAGNLEDMLFELDASGGREAVNALVRERGESRHG